MTQPTPYAAPPPAGGTDLGRIAFVLAIITVALSAIQQVTFTFLPLMQVNTGTSYSQLSVVMGVFGVVHALLALAALVVGLISAQRRRSLVLSGIAIGVGGAGVIAAIVGFVVVPIIVALV